MPTIRPPAPQCTLHPGRPSVIQIEGLPYCATCRDGIRAARLHVDRHVEPRDCFIWYASNDHWTPIAGTGCAHWVAHELNIRAESRGEGCLGGFAYRVHSLIEGRTRIASPAVQIDDIYVTPNLDHTGLVARVTPSIRIRHDSSGQGKVAENEFATYFHGKGSFFR